MVFVLTLDQRLSRRGPDRVEELLPRLNSGARRAGVLRRFERTAGDEAQGVVSAPEALAEIVLDLLRGAGWHIGVGIGPVDEPLPSSTRAGRGAAFVRAREAVERAKTAPHRVSVVGEHDYRARDVETVLWLLGAIVAHRSGAGWEVADMLAQGRTRAQIAEELGISTSAVSQRVRAAGIQEEERARELLVRLLGEADR